jgi:hypothetical protein
VAFVNPSKPAGLAPVQNLVQGLYNGQVNVYAIAAADTNAYYVGDLVKLSNSGGDGAGTPGITLAAAGNQVVGPIVAIGLQQTMGGGPGGPPINYNNLSQTYRPSGAQTSVYYAFVVDDPNAIFEIQEGGSGTNLTTTVTGQYYNIVYAAPATGVYVSGSQLDNGSGASTPTGKQLKLIRLAPRIDNHLVTSPSTGGGAQKWWVKIVAHSYADIAPTGI